MKKQVVINCRDGKYFISDITQIQDEIGIGSVHEISKEVALLLGFDESGDAAQIVKEKIYD